MTPPQINRCQIVYDMSSLSSLRSHTRDRYDNICKIFRDLYFTLAISSYKQKRIHEIVRVLLVVIIVVTEYGSCSCSTAARGRCYLPFCVI